MLLKCELRPQDHETVLVKICSWAKNLNTSTKNTKNFNVCLRFSPHHLLEI